MRARMKKYLVVTPAMNEEDMLPDLAKNIINQSIKPFLWVIVDDGSIDKTWLIIKDLEKENSWIKGIGLRSEPSNDYAHERYARVVMKGFTYAINLCDQANNDYNFLAIIDADVILEDKYFEKIINVFQSNQRLGIASGFVYEMGMSLKELQEGNAQPRGCALLFRKECYEMIGGFQGHINSLIKAQNRNWYIKTVTSVKVLHRRQTGFDKKYYYTAGKSAFFHNYHPITAFLMGVYLMAHRSPSIGFSYLYCYFKEFFQQKEKIDDEEIKQYYWGSFYRLLKHILNFSNKNMSARAIEGLKK